MPDKAFVISANMGYGHQRTAYPLRDLAFEGKIIQANDYEGMPRSDRRVWEASRKFYEFISNFKRIPIIGSFSFSLYNKFQRIFEFYPKRDLSQPNFALKRFYSILKRGWGKHLIEKFKIQNSRFKINLPVIATFPTPAFMAEFCGYPGDIFCVIPDADISRGWAPLRPKESRIKYFASNKRTAERLELYGVKSENIYLTGYPLPKENLGQDLEILKTDLRVRLLNLDPQKRYFEKYKILVESSLGQLPEKSNRPLTILFSVGGAGAQKEIGIKITRCLERNIRQGEVKIILAAGIKSKIKEYFEKEISREQFSANSVEIIFEKEINDYFKKFNEALRKTDILWTKPSELSFYSALGLPIIIAPPIGSQEDFNMRWLLKSGFGILQENPRYARQWLFDWLNEGYLAEAAMQGFIEGEKMGTFNIEKICFG